MATGWIPFVVLVIVAGSTATAIHEHVIPRPRMFPTSDRGSTGKSTEYLLKLLDGFARTDTIMDVAAKLARDNPGTADVIAREFSKETQDDVISPVVDVLVEAFRRLGEDDSERCARCKTFLGAVESLADNDVPFVVLATVLIRACEAALPDYGLSPEICPGTILLQGSHLYAVLNHSSAADMCETLNSCFPPLNSPRSSVASRLPWRQSRRQQPARDSPRDKMAAKRKRRENTFTIAQLTDIHIQPLYAEGSATDCELPVCCREDYEGEGSARRYGEYLCNIPERTMHLFLDRVAELNPDFIIYSGDTPPHTFWDETLDSQLNCSAILTSALHQKLHGRTVYPSIGNHEMYPTNMFYSSLPASQNITSAYSDSWRDFAHFDLDNEATASFLAYYSRDHNAGLKVISLNTLQDWYVYNFYGTLQKGTEETTVYHQAVEDALQDAMAAGQKVVVIGHHPSGADCMVRTSRWWQDLMTQYGDVITLHVAGHTHDDSFRLFTDPTTGAARSIIHVTPSVTSNTNVNPSMRLFHLDPDTYQLLDYENYFFDVAIAGNDQPPEIVLNYVASQEYGLPDLSAESWQDLVLRFVEDDELFQKWFHNFHTKTLSEDESCVAACKQRHLCVLWFTNYDEILECQEMVDVEPSMTSESTVTSPHPTDNSASLPGNGIVAVIVTVAIALIGF